MIRPWTVILAACVFIGALELMAALEISWIPQEGLWCGTDGPRCADLATELVQRPWSHDRVSRLCSKLPESRSQCELAWTMYHYHRDRRPYDAYIVFSVCVIAMSCSLLVAVASLPTGAEPQKEPPSNCV